MKTILRALSILCSLPACASLSNAQTADAIYQKAKAEGRVVVWSSLEIELQQKMAAKFNEKYPGIKIEPFRIQPGPSVERAITESRAGRAQVDALDLNVAYMPLLLDRDMVEPFAWSTLGLAEDQVSFGNRAVIFGQYDIPITYNTSLVKPGDIKSWDDLLDPKWKGKILLEGRGFAFAVLASKWGDDKTKTFIKGLMANQPIVVKGAQAAAEGLAGAQGAISVGAYAARIGLYKKDGAPVDWARVGPVPAQLVVLVVPKSAPHINAARLWVAFWTTPDAQAIFYQNQGYGIVSGHNLSPRGEEMKKAGVEVVLDTPDIELGRRQLEMVGRAIGTIQ
jgi:iron(III) transport system substrate-binding protein